ncbi:hypothetical protein N7457_000901 [Penicillium paradoxum]|uniref:uncharacterized protein n=1 Tax=Penicillium paradoxum TaxID=176176 RepID=UPI002546DE67|nr:uncharacterized protein N7457_000901 [Penicillium paradoxum]KAJ5794302.1 hypothetical protein N7457_000901 [Penicillium paradoxum]
MNPSKDNFTKEESMNRNPNMKRTEPMFSNISGSPLFTALPPPLVSPTRSLLHALCFASGIVLDFAYFDLSSFLILSHLRADRPLYLSDWGLSSLTEFIRTFLSLRTLRLPIALRHTFVVTICTDSCPPSCRLIRL